MYHRNVKSEHILSKFCAPDSEAFREMLHKVSLLENIVR